MILQHYLLLFLKQLSQTDVELMWLVHKDAEEGEGL